MLQSSAYIGTVGNQRCECHRITRRYAKASIPPFVRSSAAKSLGQIGNSDGGVAEGAFCVAKGLRQPSVVPAADSLVQLGRSDSRIINRFQLLLKDEDSEVRVRAALSLGKLGKLDENVLETLFDLSKAQTNSVRMLVAGSLAEISTTYSDARNRSENGGDAQRSKRSSSH